MKNTIFRFKAFFKQVQTDNIGAYAASMSFFFMLSVVPLLLIGCGILTYLPMSEQMLLTSVEQYMPYFVEDTLNNVVTQVNEQYQSILPIAVIVLLWSAGKAVWGMMMGLNTANRVVESRNILIVRFRASVYALIMLVMIIICMGGMILTDRVAAKISALVPHIAEWLSWFERFRFLLVWGILVLLMTLIYTFIPNAKLKIKYQIPGACLTSLGWSVFSWGFSIYVTKFGAFNVYGSLSTMVLIMIWMYICMYLLLIGANINRYFHDDIVKLMDRKIA